jgi:hypothetical protein
MFKILNKSVFTRSSVKILYLLSFGCFSPCPDPNQYYGDYFGLREMVWLRIGTGGELL